MHDITETNPMNLQLFAEADPAPAEAEPQTGNEPAPQQDRAFTLEEVTKLIQSEADKRVNQALAKQKREYEKKLSLSGLDEQQRASAEKDQTIAELQEKLREMTIGQNRAELVKTLAGRNLPTQFADFIDVGEDLEAAQQRIDALDTAFKQAVEEAVNRRLAGQTAPGRTAKANTATMTKEQIMAIRDSRERQAAIEKHAELFSAKKG